MTGCAAPNCSGNSREGRRLFRFPSSPRRRAKWVQNCRRDKWAASTNSRLCEAHFEENQFELRRMDGKIKLKPNAIPTIFHHSTKKASKKPSNALDIELCKAKNCTSYKNSHPVHLFPFPKNEVRCQVWIQRTQNEQLFGVLATELNLTARLCAEHFDESQFTDASKDTLVLDALPTIFPGHFVSLPMSEESEQSTLNLASQEKSGGLQFVKNEPLWESSQVSATSKCMPNAEVRLTFQELFSNASLVKLPSSLWGVHKGEKSEFVAFAHMTIPEPNIIVDKAIIFKNTCRANVYFNGRRVLLGMGEVSSLQEIEALLEQLNNLANPRSSSPTSSEDT